MKKVYFCSLFNQFGHFLTDFALEKKIVEILNKKILFIKIVTGIFAKIVTLGLFENFVLG